MPSRFCCASNREQKAQRKIRRTWQLFASLVLMTRSLPHEMTPSCEERLTFLHTTSPSRYSPIVAYLPSVARLILVRLTWAWNIAAVRWWKKFTQEQSAHVALRPPACLPESGHCMFFPWLWRRLNVFSMPFRHTRTSETKCVVHCVVKLEVKIVLNPHPDLFNIREPEEHHGIWLWGSEFPGGAMSRVWPSQH